MHRHSWSALAAAALIAPLSAAAATNAAKNRCSDAVRILRQQGSQPYKSKDVDPLKVDGVKAHLSQVVESFERAKAQIKQIPEGQFDKTDPELKECWDTLRDWADYIMLVQLKMKQAAEQGGTLGPFLDAVKPHRMALLTLAAAELAPDADVLNGASAEDAKKMLAGLADVEKQCAAFKPDVFDGPLDLAHPPGGIEQRVGGIAFPGVFTDRAKNWCFVAKRRQELMTRAAANRFVLVEGYGNYRLVIPEAVQKTSAEHPDLDAWVVEILKDKAGFLKKRDQVAQAWNQAVGVKPEATSGIGAQLDALQAKVDEAAAQLPLPKGEHHDGALEGQAKAALKKLFADAQPKGAFMDAAGWTIRQNALGVPLDRFRSGQLVFKRPAFKWCEQRTFSYDEPHQGGGRYAKGEVKILGAVRFVSCQ